MNRAVDITEIVGTFVRSDQEFEVCALAQGSYDDVHRSLNLTLDSFVRPVDLTHKERHLREKWLPLPETLHEGVAWEESSLLAREIFHRWVAKVRRCIPSFENSQPEDNHARQIQH